MQALSVILACIAAGLVGTALGWDARFVVLAAVSIGASTFIARSISRAFICLLAALGMLAILVAALIAVDASALEAQAFSWTLLAYLPWAITPAAAYGIRRARATASFGIAEVVGVIFTIFIAFEFKRHVPFVTDLLPYLVRYEDNQAWVGLLTQIHSTPGIGPGFLGFGPVVPLLLGLLGEWQRSSQPPYNAAYAAFVVAIALAPIVTVGLLRNVVTNRVFVVGAFAVVLALWVLRVPFELLATYGHLSALLAFLALIACLVLASERVSAWSTPIMVLLAYLVGAVWFPLIPLAVALLVLIAVRSALELDARGRAVSISVAAVAVLVLLNQLLVDTLGLGRGVSVGAARDTITGLYAAKGGTASLDGMLQMAVLVGIVAVAFLPEVRLREVRCPWIIVLAAVAYVVVVFAGASYLRVDIGYGPTKTWYVVGWVAVVFLVSVVGRVRMPPRAVIAVLVAVAAGSVFFGATGSVLARSFFGSPDVPDWLAGVSVVAAQERSDPRDPHPVGCFATDTFQAYRCTRWAAGLTNSGDGALINYRLQIVNGIDPTPEIEALRANGTLAKTWLLLIDVPPKDNAWAWKLIEGVGRVYDINGKPMDPRPTLDSAS
jgi:hypothetical protein